MRQGRARGRRAAPGWPGVVPLLLEELRREPDHWFIALQTLTGVDPVQEENRGDVRGMARGWLTWGARCGYSEVN